MGRHWISRLIVLFTGLTMLHRGQWLLEEPIEDQPIPDIYTFLYVIGGLIVIGCWAWPKRWNLTVTMLASMSVAIPYVLYLTWTLETFSWQRIRGTFFDLALIPLLVAWSWGNRRPTEINR